MLMWLYFDLSEADCSFELHSKLCTKHIFTCKNELKCAIRTHNKHVLDVFVIDYVTIHIVRVHVDNHKLLHKRKKSF